MEKKEKEGEGQQSVLYQTHDINSAWSSLLKKATDAYQASAWEQGIAYCQTILQQAPHQPDALHLYGLILAKQQRLPEALTALNQAIAQNPNHPMFYCNRGLLYRQMQQWEYAIADYQRAAALAPRQPEIYTALADTYLAAGQAPAAVLQYLYAYYLNGHQPPTLHHHLGNAFLQQGAWDAALLAYQKALALNPNLAETHSNLGVVYAELGDLTQAVACHRQALQVNPHYAQAYINLGLALSQQQDFAGAEAAYQQALTQLPDSASPIHNNRGNNHKAQGRWQEALNDFDQALIADLHNARARFNRGLVKLLLGDYETGWSDYEARFELKDPNHPVLHTGRPSWQGEALTGKTILIYAEQGLGDTLQWLRYLPLLKQCGAKIIFHTQTTLLPLLQGQPQLGIDRLMGRETVAWPEHDYVVPLMSLSYRLQTRLETIPATIPYLQAPRVMTLPVGAAPTAYKVGLVWRGSPHNKNDRQRSVPLAALAALFEQPGVEFYSLQYGEHRSEIQAVGLEDRLIDLSADLTTWVDTAKIVQALDLIITVDTAVAHLSGALGKPTWVLIPFVPDFRWLLDRTDSPWYPTMRLFRQSQAQRWEPVLQAVAQALPELVGVGRDHHSATGRMH